MSDGGAGGAVLAVPSMPVEENEVRLTRPVDHFVHPNQPLHRGATAALLERVEVEPPQHPPPCGGGLGADRPPPTPPVPPVPAVSASPRTPANDALWCSVGDHLRLARLSRAPARGCCPTTVRTRPRIVDSAHSRS